MAIEHKLLIKAQQKELDVVLMYQGLARRISNEKVKEVLLKCAADEGKHAAMLKKITGETLEPSNRMEKGVVFLHKLIGRRAFKFVAKGEDDGGDEYMKWVSENPMFEKMAQDEYHHGEICRKLAAKKPEL